MQDKMPVIGQRYKSKMCNACGGSGGTMLLSNPPQFQPCYKCNKEVNETPPSVDISEEKVNEKLEIKSPTEASITCNICGKDFKKIEERSFKKQCDCVLQFELEEGKSGVKLVEEALEELKDELEYIRCCIIDDKFKVTKEVFEELHEKSKKLVDAFEAEKKVKDNLKKVTDYVMKENAEEISKAFVSGGITRTYVDEKGDIKIQAIAPEDFYNFEKENPASSGIWKPVSEKSQHLKRRSHVIVKSKEAFRIAVPDFRVWENHQELIFNDILDENSIYDVEEYCTLTDFINAFEDLQNKVRELEGKNA